MHLINLTGQIFLPWSIHIWHLWKMEIAFFPHWSSRTWCKWWHLFLSLILKWTRRAILSPDVYILWIVVVHPGSTFRWGLLLISRLLLPRTRVIICKVCVRRSCSTLRRFIWSIVVHTSCDRMFSPQSRHEVRELVCWTANRVLCLWHLLQKWLKMVERYVEDLRRRTVQHCELLVVIRRGVRTH